MLSFLSSGRPKKGISPKKLEKSSDKTASEPPKKKYKKALPEVLEETRIQEYEPELGVRRTRSARIAKIREKELLDRKVLEERRMKELADEQLLKEIYRKKKEEKKAHKEKKKKKELEGKRKKRKKKKHKKKNPNDPWADSSSSSQSDEEEEEDGLEEEEEEELVFKSDHEFSPESDIEENDTVPVKRARTAREEKETIKDEQEEEAEDDTRCQKCSHEDHPETILLCDTCDHGWHLSCLRPPLLTVPEGDWVCPDCQHVELILRLKQLLTRFDATKKKAENEELQKKRLEYVSVSMKNIIGGKRKEDQVREEDERESDSESEDDSSSGSDSSDNSDSESHDSDSSGPLYTLRARRSQPIKQKFENFDELIDDAIRVSNT